MIVNRRSALAGAFALSFALSTAALAGKPEVYTGRLGKLGAGGYDVVAYFTDAAPVKGSEKFVAEHKGATWRFASAANLAKFKSDPAAFAPQYGGYCAWAVSQNYTAPGNPKNWTVVGGKLYLNYNDKVQRDWLKDPAGFIAKADVNWPAVLTK